MRNIFILTLVLSLFLVACKDDMPVNEDPGTLEITYLLTYDGEPLVMNDEYTYPNPVDLKMNFSRVNMFLAEFRLGNENIADLTFLDFSDINVNESAASSGLILRIDDVPAGNYDNLSFGVGIPEDLNATEPSDYEIGHPLSQTSEYWAGWDSYIFAKYEGKVDTNYDNTLETGFSFHTGSNASYRTLTFSEAIEIQSNETSEISIEIDAKQLFRNNGDYLDLSEIQGAHNEGAVDVMETISDNYSTAFSIRN